LRLHIYGPVEKRPEIDVLVIAALQLEYEAGFRLARRADAGLTDKLLLLTM